MGAYYIEDLRPEDYYGKSNDPMKNLIHRHHGELIKSGTRTLRFFWGDTHTIVSRHNTSQQRSNAFTKAEDNEGWS